MEWIALDATVIQTQAKPLERGKKEAKKPKRSAGLGTASAPKSMHIVDALGLSVRFALGPGQQNDRDPHDLIDGLQVKQLLR